MKLARPHLARGCSAGYALVMVMFLAALSAMALGSAIQWVSTSSRLNDRSNRYFTAGAAAEAATEKVLTKLTLDYKNGGEPAVYENLSIYRGMVPTAAESDFWNGFQFNNAQGTANQTFVTRLTTEQLVDLNSQYKGLKGWASTYRILSNAREAGGGTNSVVAAVNQDVQVASIPIFQFAIFYGLDLEINTMTTMNISGRVHGNRTLYTAPSATLTFNNDVTMVGSIIKNRKPGDPDYPGNTSGTIVYKGEKDTGVGTLSLPIGTNNTPEAVRQVLEIPPAGEAVNTTMGKQRYYNKAELTIVVTNTAVTVQVKSPLSATATTIPFSQIAGWVSTNLSFTDQREGKTVRVTQIDVSQIQAWSLGNTNVASAIGANKAVNLIYVADNRTVTSSQMNAVRLVSGQTLPSRGLTVATPNPAYILGHYNQPTSAHLGTTNTSNAKPASVVADAITILSSNWLDSKSAQTYSNRQGVNTTVNAAFLTGIVETTNSPARYSGGVHNLGRFLEDWTSDTFTYNGSMVVLFPSVKATAPFQQPGAYYYPPARNFAFDLNYTDITKQPPGTPELRTIIRGSWTMAAPGTTNIVVLN